MKNKPIHAAYHEAGHAVAAFHFGQPVEKLDIIPAVVRKGIRAGRSVQPERKTNIFTEVFVLLAGPVAEQRLRGRYNWIGAHGDLADAEQLASSLPPKKRKDFIKATIVTLQNMFDDNPNLWLAVERIAKELLERQQMTGKQAERIYSDTTKGEVS